MSFDINWEKLSSDRIVQETMKEFLDRQLKSLELPSFMKDISVTEFNLGSQAPEIIIRDICEPFDEFYEDDDDELIKRAQGLHFSKRGESNCFDSDSDESFEPMGHDISISEEMTLNSSSGNDLNNDTLAPHSRESEEDVSHKNDFNPSGSRHNFVHNYNVNNVGLGNLNNPTTHTRTDSPANIFNSHHYNSLKSGKIYSRLEQSYIFQDKDQGTFDKMENKSNREENDIQFVLEVKYEGDLYLCLSVSLVVNYPSSGFIVVPINLKITSLDIHSILIISYLKNASYISFLCDIDDHNSDYFSSKTHSSLNKKSDNNSGGNFIDYNLGSANRERIDIIKHIKIESEIGNAKQNVLRNVGKVESFLIEKIRDIIRDELAWPSWICIDLNEYDSDDE